MIKKSALKKMLISTLALIIVFMFYLFPNSIKKNEIKEEVILNDISKATLYIPNKDNYVSRITVIEKEKNIIDKVKEIISYLTINNIYNEYLPNNFIPIIPENTKIIDCDFEDDLLKINFSSELLNVSLNNERKMVESIVYSLTEINGINKIMIFVEGSLLDRLPNSKEKLPIPLDRNIGINLVYEIDNFKNTNKVTTYYISKNDSYYYYIPISKITNSNDEKIEVIISELKSSPIYQTNLMSFLKEDAKLLDYQILEHEIHLNFNNYLFDDINKKNILEEVKYSIALSIKDTYNINNIIFTVNDTSEKLLIK